MLKIVPNIISQAWMELNLFFFLRTIGCGTDKFQNILTNFLLFFRYKSYKLNQLALECYLLIQKVSCFKPSVFRFFQMLCVPSDICECAKFVWFLFLQIPRRISNIFDTDIWCLTWSGLLFKDKSTPTWSNWYRRIIVNHLKFEKGSMQTLKGIVNWNICKEIMKW